MSEENVSTTDTTTETPSQEGVVVSENTAPAEGSPPAQSGTILQSGPAETPVATVADWPDDWRTRLAGEDKSYLKTLERFASPADLARSYRELQSKVSQGQLKAALKPDATPEEVAAWRRENGLPETIDGYKPDLGDGIVLGEAEKPMIDAYRQFAFENNIPPALFNQNLKFYYQLQDQAQQQQAAADHDFRIASEVELQKEWGPGYKTEVRGIMNFLEANAPPGLTERLFNGRTADGTVIGNDPTVLRWLASVTRMVNPMATLVPAGSADIMKAGEARIAEIETVMKTDPRKYWGDQSLQTEYGRLLEAREASRNRAA